MQIIDDNGRHLHSKLPSRFQDDGGKRWVYFGL
jgi:hypothetical protein